MSTRANIIIKDNYDKLYFYRHSDGYPEGTLPTLEKFLLWVKEGRIRDNVSQAAGWLVIIGNVEYEAGNEPKKLYDRTEWKVGAYEPSPGLCGGIEHLYIIDLNKKMIEHYDSDFELHDK